MYSHAISYRGEISVGPPIEDIKLIIIIKIRVPLNQEIEDKVDLKSS
jgi:hypothetical protein